jgi:CRISPR-associated protein Cmr4
MNKHLITLYTQTPLHVGCGSSVDVVDLPIARERVTNFPIIPASGLKGVMREAARQCTTLEVLKIRLLFGEERSPNNDPNNGEIIEARAGCVQFMEAKLLCFPVRSLRGCFSWLTCPTALLRYQRDSGSSFPVPRTTPGHALAGADVKQDDHVFLEEYTLEAVADKAGDTAELPKIVKALQPLSKDPLWTSHLSSRLAIVSDEDFQHFVTTATEIVQRIAIDPTTRTVKGTGLFSQENVPCEALFYTVLTLMPTREAKPADLSTDLETLLKPETTPTLQIGGDETTGHGFCALNHLKLPFVP